MPSPSTERPPLLLFFGVVAVLAVIRLLMAAIPVATALVVPLSLLSTLTFIGGPIYALYIGGSEQWVGKRAGLVFGLGVLMHVVGFLMARPTGGLGPLGLTGWVLMQSGVLVWCLGLGGLVSLMLKDRALLLPVALFLAGFDVFLVATPFAPTASMVEQHPEIVKSVAMSVPKAREAEPGQVPGARAVDLGLVGPADLAFMGMFFASLHRFRMRARSTVLWLVPVMALYFLLAVSPVGIGMLPAMLPIGATVILVNLGAFGLRREEVAATVVVALISLGLAGYGIYARVTYKPPIEAPVEPSNSEPVPELGAPAGSLAPTSSGRSPS